MQYVYEQKLTSINYARKIPKHKTIDQAKLPSTYAPEEIEKLLKSIDRTSPVGKRNYAMILLAARLGLRASDIVRLTFDQLQWESSSLNIRQYKIGKELTLPLLADVGNALIDYLRFGRPKSTEPRVFLSERPPRGRLNTSNVVTHVVQRAFLKVGINTKNKRSGPHALRHSLSFSMLNAQTALPVITEVLDHKNTGSTKYYLRIDLGSMKQCMLDVPVVSPDFYLQKQELFYEKDF